MAALRLAGLAACWFAGAALATPPNEIKVFTDELAAYREHTLETHVNKGSTGPLQVMPEYSYGIARDWEFSLQLPFAFTSDSANGEGYRVELQYVAPHDGQRPNQRASSFPQAVQKKCVLAALAMDSSRRR